ncbi:hypothetical protein [Sphingomonas sp. 35-24ZXX]|uniref:hypothetical protein n=1 Tax=Sphingomonas sp. 35-24ZXX TaxID=1545915 RepID=UPI000A7C6257|nr:hypothetical protein [Sphingomonas sp. 35-24ZXX]
MPGREALAAAAISSVAVRRGTTAATGPLPQTVRSQHGAAATATPQTIAPRRP